MKSIIKFFTRYPVWTNVLLFSVLIFGVLMMKQMKYSFFPEIPPNIINIQVVYPGASPEEMEEGVVLKIEEQLDGLEGVERVTSLSRENTATITVEVLKGYETDKVLTDVKNAIDRINSFPVDMEKPIVFEQKMRTRALSIVLYGNADRFNLKYIADDFRDDLIALEEISQVTITGLPKLEISIEVSEADLRRYHIRLDEIAAAVRKANVNISGGKFDTPDEEILIRAYGRRYYPQELRGIVIRGKSGGDIVKLGDLATIRERWEDSPEKTYFNSKPAVILNVDKTITEDIIAVEQQARKVIEKFNAKETGVKAEILDNRTIPLKQRISLLLNNGMIGLLLVVLSLTFFMNLRLSLWVSLGIPFAFAGMFIVISWVGITINVISLFGMIIVVGILVDDAIVVGENIYSHYESGKSAFRSAIDGTIEVLPAVSTSILTTIIAFMPFFFLDGFFGKFIWQMALVVIASLIFSLVESMLILPAHLAHSKGLHPHKEDKPIRKRIEKFISWLTNDFYAPLLDWSMKNKWITVSIPLAFTLAVVGLVKGGIIRSTFFPFIDGDTLPVNISFNPGTQEYVTDSTLANIERLAAEVNREYRAKREDGKDLFLSAKREIGKNDFGEIGAHAGKVTFQLLDGEERNLDSYILANSLREKIGEIEDINKLSVGRTNMFGKPVSISLLGTDIATLKYAKELFKDKLREMPELKDVTDSDVEGLRELNIKLKPRALALGFSLADIAGKIRDGFFGREVQRLQRGRDEIRVWVRYKDSDRTSIDALRKMRILTPTGQSYPLGELAEFHIDRGIITISHLNRQREIKIEADLVDQEDDLPEILSYIKTNIEPEILAYAPGVRTSYEGQSRFQKKIKNSALKSVPIALIGIVVIMILVFRSYLQSVLVFSLIPFGILGAYVGHGLHGIPVNILSVYGLIALAGIVVNDSIVFIDQINRNLKRGLSVHEAVHKAGVSRLRPILLTTFTTVLGLAPLILETSKQAQFLIPMAVSVAYGLLIGTFLILIVLPSSYLVMNKFRRIFRWLISGNYPDELSVEPAIVEERNINKWGLGDENENN